MPNLSNLGLGFRFHCCYDDIDIVSTACQANNHPKLISSHFMIIRW